MLLTYSDYSLAVSDSKIDQGHVALSADDQRSWFVCWTPITWGDHRTNSLLEADDWKDVIFPASSEEEAREIALRAFGSEARFEIEPVHSVDELSEENIDATVDELDKLFAA